MEFEGEQIPSIYVKLTKENIEKIITKELDILKLLLEKDKELTIDGPIRKFHIGKYVKMFLTSPKNTFKEELYSLMRRCQYIDMNARNSHLLKLGNDTILTVYGNENENLVLQKADILAIPLGENELLQIPFNVIDEIKPKKWEDLDEFQFYAPQLDDHEWIEFIKKAKKYKIV